MIQEAPKFSEELKELELELEPEILPDITRCLSTSGKRDDAPRAKPLKPKLKERKALRDVSNTLKGKKALHDLSNTINKRPALRSHEAVKNPVKIFTVEETNAGLEDAHFTGNDPQKLDKDVHDKRKNLSLVIAFWFLQYANGFVLSSKCFSFFHDLKKTHIFPCR